MRAGIDIFLKWSHLFVILFCKTINHLGLKVSDLQKMLDDFVIVVKELRSLNGCPWDRQQTPLSLKRYLVEETDELLEAIDSDDKQHVKEELGDLLYIIVLMAQIYSEEGSFAINDVIETVKAKMIRRHPHVFNNEKIDSIAELRKMWLEIKDSENADRTDPKKN
ncbi:MAG: nucleotide pyrophosphohydrolase [Deltaproteobacteria bacterium]|jgi:MazG family protein|nr:nucleotide pyrophosphohydrolase [Deltaproteobacteria bacterium]